MQSFNRYAVAASRRMFSTRMGPLRAPLTPGAVQTWAAEVAARPTDQLAATVLQNHGPHTALIKREPLIKSSVNLFNNMVSPQGAPVMNQKQSGRCWLFAATNVLRVDVMRRLNLKELKLSPGYLFFYDKLEKAHFFLDQVRHTRSEPVESRVVQHLLMDPVCDGGQYSMFTNVIQKYGLVPDHVFPDTFNTLASSHLNEMVTTSLRQYAQEIREFNGSDSELDALIEKQTKEIHRLLVLFLGAPPAPTEPITWEYVDKDDKYHSLETTPLGFYKDVIQYDTAEAVSLLNDPRNKFETVVEVDRLGNVVGEPYVRYLNVDADTLAQQAVAAITANKPVFFGTHTPLYHDRKSGVIDTKLWAHDSIGFNPTQNKADRLRYHESLMTHAMTFTGVHLDPKTGEPIRWKVENSWGKEKVGQEGYFIMTHDYFKEYVYQIVVDRSALPEPLRAKWDARNDPSSEKVVLPPWDPCGSLAK